MSAFSWKRAKINEYFNSLKLQLFLNTKSLEMARSCCICSTFDGNKVLELQKNPPVRYHCIPRNKKVRRIWVKFLKKTVPGFRLSKDPRVCNLHFTESDYKSFEPIPQLNRGALPSLHLKPVTEPVARRTDKAASRVSVSKCYRKSLTKRTKKRKEETVRSSNHDENTNKSTNRLSRSVSRNFRGPVAHEKRKAAKHPKTCCICKLYDRQIVRETREKLNRRISFHKFPFGKRNRALMMKWTMAISKVIPGFEANVSLRVCGLHFSESDYKVLAEHSNQYLKEGSVPSLYMRLRDFTSDSVEVNRDSSRSRCDDNTNESSASLSRSEYNDESTTETSFRSETSAEFTTSESRYNESSVDESSFGDDTSGEYSSFSESNNSEISLRGSELSEPSTSSSSKISQESRSECLDTSFESTSNDRRDGENSFCNRSSSESERKDGSDDGNLFCSESSSESGGDENLFGSQSSSESKSNDEANGNSFGSEIASHSMSNDEVVDENLSPRRISSESKSKSHDIDVDENSELTIPMEIDPNDENIDSPVIPSCDSDQPLLDDNVGETCVSSPTSQQLRGPDAEGSKSNGSEHVDSSENRNDKLEGVDGAVISNGLDQNQDNAMDLSNEKNDNESSTSMEPPTIQKPRVVFSNKDDEITNRVSEPSMTTFPAPEPASEDITESLASGQSDTESRVFAEQSQSPRKEIPTVVKREADRVPTPRKSKSPFKSIRFECSYCTESYDDAEGLREHKRWHADSRHYKCGFCDKILSSCQSWEYHVNVHAGYKPYTCDHCEKEFVTKQALKTHTRCNKHKCQFCGQSFHSKSKLKEHRKTHTEEEIHRCNICDRYFPKLSALNIHKSKHKTKTTYECQYCGNVYESKAELQYHIKLTGENLLICPTCLDTFEDYLDFKIHLLDHTEKESFVCTVCDKTFVSTDILEDHILSIHNDRSGGAFS